jgi:hypothetical protein
VQNQFAIKFVAVCACCMRVFATFVSKNGPENCVLSGVGLPGPQRGLPPKIRPKCDLVTSALPCLH